MVSLTQIFAWFKENMIPSEDQFRETWSSFWHKSEKLPQSQILGLNDELNKLETEKADKSELQNVVTGTNILGEKANLTAIQAITTPIKGDTYKAVDTGHYWKYNAVIDENNPYSPDNWIDVGKLLPSDVAKNSDLTFRNFTRNEVCNEFIKEIYIEGAQIGDLYIYAGIWNSIGASAPRRIIQFVDANNNMKVQYLITSFTGRYEFFTFSQNGITIRAIVDWEQVRDKNAISGNGAVSKAILLSDAYSLDCNPRIQESISSAKLNDKTNIDSVLFNYIKVSNSYLNTSGNIQTNNDYSLLKYPVKKNDVRIIKGSIRGMSVMSYAVYSSETNISSETLLLSGQLVNNTSAEGQAINISVKMPQNAILLVVTDYNSQMNVFTQTSISDYVVKLSSQTAITDMDAEGDSLEEGAIAPGVFGTPSTVYLQQMVGDRYRINNNGYSGETTVEIGARHGGMPAVTAQDYTIPHNRAWLPMNLVSSYNGNSVRPLRQKPAGTSLPAMIDGIKGTIQFWSNSVQFVRDVDAGDGKARFIPKGTPILIGNGYKNRNQAASYWIGTNGGYNLADNNDLINQLKILIGFRNNNNYLVLGLYHPTGERTVEKLDELEVLMSKEFGLRFVNIRRYFLTNALADCGIEPTTADNLAISQGLCPPSLLGEGDTVHTKQVVQLQIAKLKYNAMLINGMIYT